MHGLTTTHSNIIFNTMTYSNNSGRLENTTTCLPIAYGSVAFYLGPQSEEYKTHQWTLYVRSPDPNFDLSVAISKVVFQLHPSFAQPTRELTEPPFEITEKGWGEFEASIRIYWAENSEERSTMISHGIRLYPNRAPATSQDPSAFMNTSVPGEYIYIFIYVYIYFQLFIIIFCSGCRKVR